MVKSIELSPEQEASKKELMKYILAIESAMEQDVDYTIGDNVAFSLNIRIGLLSTCPRMMEIATALYGNMKGEAAREAMSSPEILGLKADVQRKWFEGRLARWNALYERAEMSHKHLFNSIEGLRSLLSYEKTLARAIPS